MIQIVVVSHLRKRCLAGGGLFNGVVDTGLVVSGFEEGCLVRGLHTIIV